MTLPKLDLGGMLRNWVISEFVMPPRSSLLRSLRLCLPWESPELGRSPMALEWTHNFYPDFFFLERTHVTRVISKPCYTDKIIGLELLILLPLPPKC